MKLPPAVNGLADVFCGTDEARGGTSNLPNGKAVLRGDISQAMSSSVPRRDLISETNVEEVNDRLQDGIATCRTIIENYRSLLSDEDLAGASSTEVSAEAPIASDRSA